MSFDDGWAAINLEMPKRVPRAEFDAERHWQLVTQVTGIEVGVESPPQVKHDAARAFMQAWNYDLRLGQIIWADQFDETRSHMGHAEYEAGGVDYDGRIDELFTDPEDVFRFDPMEAYGRRHHTTLVRWFNSAHEAMREYMPTCVNMTGIYVTLITGLTYILGWDMLLLACGTDPKRFGELVNRYADWVLQFYEALADSDVPVCYCHDDMVWTSGAVFRPDWYREYVFPNYKRLWRPLLDAGKKPTFICDGDYTEFIDDVADCGAAGFFFEPLTDLEPLVERYGQTHFLIGNVDTRVLLANDRKRIRAEVERCMALGKSCPGYFIGVTNMIPANTPVEAALYYHQCYEELCER